MITCIILHNTIIEDDRDFETPIEVSREFPPTSLV